MSMIVIYVAGSSPPSVAHSVSSLASSPRPPTVMTDDEKRMHQQFVQDIDDAHNIIKNAKTKVNDVVNDHRKSVISAPHLWEISVILYARPLQAGAGGASASAALSVGECVSKRALLQRHVARAAVAVADLVAAHCEYPTLCDTYNPQARHRGAIVKTASQLSGALSRLISLKI